MIKINLKKLTDPGIRQRYKEGVNENLGHHSEQGTEQHLEQQLIYDLMSARRQLIGEMNYIGNVCRQELEKEKKSLRK